MKMQYKNKAKIIILITIIVAIIVTIYFHAYKETKIKTISVDLKINNAQNTSEIQIKEAEYTEEYKEWLKLSEEERKKYVEPDHYGIPYYEEQKTNKLRQAIINIFTSKLAPSKYDLRTNTHLTVKNQMDTASCWAFSATTMLESNIELKTRNSLKIIFTKTYRIRNIKELFRWNKC